MVLMILAAMPGLQQVGCQAVRARPHLTSGCRRGIGAVVVRKWWQTKGNLVKMKESNTPGMPAPCFDPGITKIEAGWKSVVLLCCLLQTQDIILFALRKASREETKQSPEIMLVYGRKPPSNIERLAALSYYTNYVLACTDL